MSVQICVASVNNHKNVYSEHCVHPQTAENIELNGSLDKIVMDHLAKIVVHIQGLYFVCLTVGTI